MSMSFGWMRDLPDVRDYTEDHPAVSAILQRSRPLKQFSTVQQGAPATVPPANPTVHNRPSPQPPGQPQVSPQTPVAAVPRLPASVDLRQWCSPVVDQGNLGSCTSNACAGILEYFENRAFGRNLSASRLFIYKATRDLLGLKGDSGAYLRSTMQALVLFGTPPEKYWPYNVSKFDTEPTAFNYAFATNYKAIQYYRLDPSGTTPATLLTSIKTKLAAGLPSMFGFTVYSSMSNSPDIPYPKKGDTVLGGHAISCVGFDDSHKIGSDTGALLIRNSWGTSWGSEGYGWLPYSYVLKGLAADFWTLVQASFVDTALFQ